MLWKLSIVIESSGWIRRILRIKIMKDLKSSKKSVQSNISNILFGLQRTLQLVFALKDWWKFGRRSIKLFTSSVFNMEYSIMD